MSSPRFFLDAVPKAGAHLLEGVLAGLGCPRGQRPLGASAVLGRNRFIKGLLRRPRGSGEAVLVGVEIAVPVRAGWVGRRLDGVEPGTHLRGHVQHSETFAALLEERGFRLLHLVRDPRDVVVSHAHYVRDRPRHVFHAFYRDLGSWEEQLAFSIRGGRVPGVGRLLSVAERYRSMEGWEGYPDALTLRFEHLVGEAGGGGESEQRRSLLRLARWMDRAPEAAEALVGRVFGSSSTFRRGQVGGWREAFSARHRELFTEIGGEVLERWGYA